MNFRRNPVIVVFQKASGKRTNKQNKTVFQEHREGRLSKCQWEVRQGRPERADSRRNGVSEWSGFRRGFGKQRRQVSENNRLEDSWLEGGQRKYVTERARVKRWFVNEGWEPLKGVFLLQNK